MVGLEGGETMRVERIERIICPPITTLRGGPTACPADRRCDLHEELLRRRPPGVVEIQEDFGTKPDQNWSVAARLRLADLLGGLSIVADLGFGLPPETAMRSCLIATCCRRTR
jgi:hypothetical protein